MSIRLVTAAAAALLLGGLMLPSAAQAEFRLYFGVPHYDYNVGPGYIFRPGFGWYLPPRVRVRFSCDRAADALADRGYYRIVARDCRGPIYVFRAWRDGRRYTLTFNNRTGRISRS